MNMLANNKNERKTKENSKGSHRKYECKKIAPEDIKQT